MPDSIFEVGDLAEHSRKSDWGPGKVVKVRPPYVWVFFRGAPGQAARQFPASLLVRASSQTDAILENLPAFVEQDGAQLLPSERYTLQEALGILHAHAPDGFGEGGTTKAHKDRQRRRAAHAEYVSSLAGGQAEALLEQGDLAELAGRALKVIALAPALSSADMGALREGLRDEERGRRFFATLLPFLAGEPSQEAFEAYAAASRGLRDEGAAGTAWPIVTLLPALARPEQHMFLHPTVSCAGALRLGFHLAYSVDPSWRTYDALCRLGRAYLEALSEAGARDLIDVHFFLTLLVAKPVARPAAANAAAAD